MADTSGGGWNGFTAIDGMVAAAVAVASYLGGIWTRGSNVGREQGDMAARMTALSDRMTYMERRHDLAEDKLAKMDERLDEKMSKMAERIAETPTRTEMAAYFNRLEAWMKSQTREA